MRSRLSAIASFLLALTFVVSSFGYAQAQSAPPVGTVSGTIADQVTGSTIPDAGVTLFAGDTFVATTRTDSRGGYTFTKVPPGTYTIVIAAVGYVNARSNPFAVVGGDRNTVNVVVSQASVESGRGLRTIANTTVSAGNALESTTTITRVLDPALVTNENLWRASDALKYLPGVNLSGLSSAVADDQSIDIRGLGTSETQTLLDGHPVGPIGVYAISGGGGIYPGAFNFADSPVNALSRIQVTFGSGATGLYGVDKIGGSIDMQTLNPTTKPEASVLQGAGDQGKLETYLRATGTYGRIGYAFAAGVSGTYGDFAPQVITQTGRPNNNNSDFYGGACNSNANLTMQGLAGVEDLSQCNLTLNTYNVSGNATQRSGLAKLVFALSPNTSITGTLFASGHQADSTGNGDNDNIPYDTRLAQVLANGPAPVPSNAPAPINNCPSSAPYPVITQNNLQGTNVQSACYTAQQVAQNSYGPQGGGQDRNRGTNLADYHVRFQTVNGNNTLTGDTYYNQYRFYKSSQNASGLDSTGQFLEGTEYTQYLNSVGYLISDDIAGEKSDFGFGYFGSHQTQLEKDFQFTGLNMYSYQPAFSSLYNSGFARASYTFSPVFSVFANGWVKHASSDNTTSFDPRISLVFRPSGSDVFRVTYGHTTGDPADELKANGPPSITANPSSFNPFCGLNSIGTGGNPALKPEVGDDYEVGFAHRFRSDSSIQVNLYQTQVTQQLFGADEPLAQYGATSVPATLLQGFAQRLAQAGCAGVDAATPSTAIPYLAISNTYNASSASYRGVEITGRARVTRRFYIDYGYDIQSARQFGITNTILMTNAFLINGGQIYGIPINKGTVGVDYANAGFEARMDGYVVGNNNESNRPGYNTWNGFISKSTRPGLTFTFGVSNVFNEAVQNYGYFGHQFFVPENSFFHDTNSIQQFLNNGGEEFGLPPRSFIFTIQAQV